MQNKTVNTIPDEMRGTIADNTINDTNKRVKQMLGTNESLYEFVCEHMFHVK